jgi:aldehyde:ferredoxin oxidoreductase
MDEKNKKSGPFKKEGRNRWHEKKFTRRKFLKYSGKAGLAMAASAVGGAIGGKLHRPHKVAAQTNTGTGYWSEILWVDLTKGTVSAEDPTIAFPGIYENFLGGYGLGARILYTRQKPRAHPLGSSNIFGFAAGPLTGTQASVGSRCTFFAKSPLTRTWGDSNVGGRLGPALKFAQFDAVFVTGKSRQPVYLFIENGSAELRPARRLWGKDTYEAHDILNNELAEAGKEVVVASIGPAAEKLSLISCIDVGRGGHAGGRSGLGAVMGSKRLKAIAIKVDEMSPDATVPVADKEGIEYLTGYLRGFYGKDPYSIPYGLFNIFGPCGLNVPSALSGDSPVKNWKGIGTEDFFPAAYNIDGKKILKMQSEPEGCWSCPVRCHGRLGKLGTDPEADKPYYENCCSLGTLCLVDDLDAIINASEICNRYSLDTISTGSTIAFAMECFEKGIIDRDYTDGIDLSWGKAEGMLAMAERMAKRRGMVGKIFGDGSTRAAERIKELTGKDPKEFGAIPVHVQNQDLPMHDSRFSPSLALAYKSDATPGRHTQGGAGIVEMFRLYLPMLVDHDPYDYKDPGRIEAAYAILKVYAIQLPQKNLLSQKNFLG